MSRDRVAKGELTLKLVFAAQPSGQVQIAYAIKAKHPSKPTSVGVQWLTSGGNFSARNPRQDERGPLREVGGGAQPAREVEVGAARAGKEIG